MDRLRSVVPGPPFPPLWSECPMGPEPAHRVRRDGRLRVNRCETVQDGGQSNAHPGRMPIALNSIAAGQKPVMADWVASVKVV